MKNATKTQNQWLLALGLIVAAAMTRLLPHPYNFTPIGGMALFAGAIFRKHWFTFLIPFLALWVSDLLLNNLVYGQYFESFSWFGNTGTYLGFAAIFLLGRYILGRVAPGKLVKMSLIGSAVFFLISNGLVWLQGSVGMPIAYPMTLSGLMACYAAGLPFFGGTLAGDLFYNTVLFGTWYWVHRNQATWQVI
ncbi:MAG: hypothetical protein K9I85_06835 [Saprospiraceae bacterium]|nr:hypothetical protein [Saprospiraceae bacterium]